jgi:dihydrodipicolinate synthase/N-acetylneuraminate lyase
VTHYDDRGRIDGERMAAHIANLAPHVKGLLVPGSTGDGWEMESEEVREVLGLALEAAGRHELHLLAGVLKTGGDEALRMAMETAVWLRERTGVKDMDALWGETPLCGFTFCPPKGAELSQGAIQTALEGLLEAGYPTALYQLPQVTLNEMEPGLVADLARRFGNFILFKDTSGADHVALSGEDLEGVVLVRGAEGDYAKWPSSAGGPYHGFLLSTANCLAGAFAELLEYLDGGEREAARELSGRLTLAVNEVFDLVTGLPEGNAFANANKAMDHYFAHGPEAAGVIPPRLHAGGRMPREVVRSVGGVLERHRLMPRRGYLG